MQSPMLVLKDSLKRESGSKVHYANIQASKVVANIIHTTLGPRSMLKRLLDAGGGIVVTNDENAIFRKLDLAHPAAKSMIELSRTQDEEVGDGKTSVIILAGEMLHVAEAFIDKKFHPIVICRAYNKALEDALAVLDKISMSIDVKDRATMLRLVKSCIGTKFTSQFGDLIAWPYEAAAIAFEAIPRTLAQNCGVNVIRTMTSLQGKHANGENAWTGIDENSGEITDMKERKIWDAYNVKAQTFKTTIEAVCMLLRIDDIVSGIKKKQAPGAGAQKPKVETEGDADNKKMIPE